MNPETSELVRQIDERIAKVVPKYLQSNAFTARKLTDTPTDDNQVVPRGYVTNNGLSANRPVRPVVGQPFLDLTIGKPIWYTVAGWIDATGTLV